MSIASPLVLPSPNGRRVGIRIVTFEACSGFTRVTAHRIAQPPRATFVTGLRPCRLPDKTARQLPDQSTIIRVRPSLTGSSRLRGARPTGDIRKISRAANQAAMSRSRRTRTGCRKPFRSSAPRGSAFMSCFAMLAMRCVINISPALASSHRRAAWFTTDPIAV